MLIPHYFWNRSWYDTHHHWQRQQYQYIIKGVIFANMMSNSWWLALVHPSWPFKRCSLLVILQKQPWPNLHLQPLSCSSYLLLYKEKVNCFRTFLTILAFFSWVSNLLRFLLEKREGYSSPRLKKSLDIKREVLETDAFLSRLSSLLCIPSEWFTKQSRHQIFQPLVYW